MARLTFDFGQYRVQLVSTHQGYIEWVTLTIGPVDEWPWDFGGYHSQREWELHLSNSFMTHEWEVESELSYWIPKQLLDEKGEDFKRQLTFFTGQSMDESQDEEFYARMGII